MERKQRWMWMFLALAPVALPVAMVAQQPNAVMVSAERGAIQKLAFLTGRWSGPVTIYRGSGKALQMTQQENVQYKVGGLVMLIEGRSTDGSGRVRFDALATIAYDPARHEYRIRAYSGGRYLDTRLTVEARGFRWGFREGPAQVVNSMHLTGQGEWLERTQATVGSNAPQRSMQMVLRHNQ